MEKGSPPLLSVNCVINDESSHQTVGTMLCVMMVSIVGSFGRVVGNLMWISPTLWVSATKLIPYFVD